MTFILERAHGSSEAHIHEKRAHAGMPRLGESIITAIVIAAVILLSILAWKIKVWRRRKRVRQCGGFGAASGDEEKLRRLVLVPPKPNPGVNWTPQSRNGQLPDLHAVQNRDSTYKPPPTRLGPFVAMHRFSNRSTICTPPPTYHPYNYNPQPSSPNASVSPISSPLPPAPALLTNTTTALSLPHISLSGSFAPALPSPTRSFTSDVVSQRASISMHNGGKLSARAMTVINDFSPTLPDELSLSAGDVVLLLDEYADMWCLIQRIESGTVEKGVVPRCCLQDLPKVLPGEYRLSSDRPISTGALWRRPSSNLIFG